MTDRDAILGAIQDRPSGYAESSPVFNLAGGDLLEQFQRSLEALGGRVIEQEEFDARLVRPFWADPVSGLTSTAANVWDAEVGVSVAHAAIAATGSLILANTAGTYRMSSLAPPVSMVILHSAKIVASLSEAFDGLPTENVVFVSGTSRTADIEGVMVRGVHGPGELLVLMRNP